MFTSFTSKGMYCSASHWMLSSSSSWLMRGMEIFLMITLWPLTPMATSRFFSLYWERSWRMASTMAVEFKRGYILDAFGVAPLPPEAIVDGVQDVAALGFLQLDELHGRRSDVQPERELALRHRLLSSPLRLERTLPPGDRPYKKTVYPPVSTEYLPTTTEPARGLLPSPVPVPAPVAAPAEQLGRLLHREAEREEDLALGLQAAVLAGLDAVDGGFRDSRLARELRLRHQLLFPEPLDVVHAP